LRTDGHANESNVAFVNALSAYTGVEWSGVEWSGVEWSGVEDKAHKILDFFSLDNPFVFLYVIR
jgi:hypothetical protein